MASQQLRRSRTIAAVTHTAVCAVVQTMTYMRSTRRYALPLCAAPRVGCAIRLIQCGLCGPLKPLQHGSANLKQTPVGTSRAHASTDAHGTPLMKTASAANFGTPCRVELAPLTELFKAHASGLVY